MDKLSVGGKFDWYLDTLNKSGTFVINLSDKEIETYIFEDLIVGVVSYFNKNNLKELNENGLIDDEIEQLSLKFREGVLKLDGSDLWNINSVKASSEWIDIFELSDSIRKKIHQRWTDKEIEYLKTT